MNHDYIPFEDFVPYSEDLLRGEQIHINHDNCTAGADTKRRLYIKRTEDGTNILAYCHNCSLHGRYVQDFGRAIAARSRNTGNANSCNAFDYESGRGKHGETDKRATTPRNSEYDIRKWRREHRLWLQKYGIITPKETDLYKICANEDLNGVILPVYRDKLLLGYQLRTFDGGDKPKYITRRVDNNALWWYSGDYLLQSSPSDIVIVEDMLSGIKCARYSATVALLGANIGDDLLAFLLQKAIDKTRFTIFLDDDNRQIRMNQLKIKVKLEQCGYETRIITGMGKDPKECSDEELRRLLL